MKDDLERFMSKVSMVPIAGCWIYMGALDGHGYGHFWIEGQVDKAHRASWRLHRGALESGKWVLHRCDNPACVNPDHLFVGDRVANMRDMASKGRQVFQANPEKIARGQRSARAKLTDEQAMAILRGLRAGCSGSALARRFGVAKCTVSAIKVGRNWAHLQEQAAMQWAGA